MTAQNAQIPLDDTDRRLLQLLRQNARLPVASLAASLNVARGTAQARLDRLLATGIIQGFTIRTRPEGEAAKVRAIMMVELAGGRMNQVIRSLRALPEVSSIHTTNGRWDLVLELAAGDLAQFDEVLRRVRQIEGVAGSETSLLLPGPS